MSEIPLPGCTPEPLMSYLKALGVFRLMAEQKDPGARLFWRGGTAVLETNLDRDGLVRFFLEEYKPTPVIAPWNGGSGFYDGAQEPLRVIERSTSPRLESYRQAIRIARTLVPAEKPKDDDKLDLLISCRNELPDDIGAWLDTCYALREDGIGFFPLLGTGANDGRLEFTSNFFQRVADVVAVDGAPVPLSSEPWFRSVIFGDVIVSLEKSAIGQFNPGGIGGPNGRQGDFEAGSRVNPWDYVLMIEGAMLFAGSVSRRLGTGGSAKAAFPFSVDSVAVGYGSATASEETTDGSRAELWLPLWDAPATSNEVARLFAEGRAQLGRKQARNAVEFALAVNLLGVSRGISSFSRYGFLKRNGLAFLAAPLGRIAVHPRPLARLLQDPPLVDWIDRLRRACNDKDRTPARYQSALRGIDRTMFDFANRSEEGNDAKYLTGVLAAVGRAERTLANGLRFSQEKYIRPMSGLSAQWLTQADDGSIEFRLAAGLAGIQRSGDFSPLRSFLEEVKVTKFVEWQPGSTSAVWSQQPLAANLAAVFRRRQLEASRTGVSGVPLDSKAFARLDDVIAFLHGETDDDKLADLIWGLLGIDWRKVKASKPVPSHQAVPAEFGIPRLTVQDLKFGRFQGQKSLRWITTKNDASANVDPEVFHALGSGQANAISDSVTKAARRLKSGGLPVNGYRNRRHSGDRIDIVSTIDPTRLLAAMLFPLSNRDLTRIANSVLYPPESEE